LDVARFAALRADWIWMRRAAWIPTLRKKREGV